MKEFLSLEHKSDVTIEAKVPFNFRYTVRKPSHFPTNLEFYDEKSNCFYRSMRHGEMCLGLKMHSLKKDNRDHGIVLQIFSATSLNDSEIQEIKKRVSRSYGLEEDITEFYSAVKDARAKEIIRRLEGMRNSCIENLFEILNISIILQNANVQRSQKMLANLLYHLGNRIYFDGVMLDVFYSPQRLHNVTEPQLRELGLGYRSRYILELAKLFCQRKSFEKEIRSMPSTQIREELLKIKGVGPYSANLVLFSYFRNPQFINFDVWNRRIISNFVFGKEVEFGEVEKECKRRWGAFMGYVALYVIENHFLSNTDAILQLTARR
jgi:3-methyladenine DNA glycosylase/8-oxoguanine DNA glycosylase